jgi:SAM-dependent methyltransferase
VWGTAHAALQILDAARAQPRALGQLLLGQSRCGPIQAQQLPEPAWLGIAHRSPLVLEQHGSAYQRYLRAPLRAHGVLSGRLPSVTLRRVKTQTGQGLREAVPVMALTAVTYGLDQSWYGERDRLRVMSDMFDDTTLACCERPGARVLELGAGAGRKAMADRVGCPGRVVAVDRDIRFLCDRIDQFEVFEIDILRAPRLSGAFDLVHARMLLGHLGEPMPALQAWMAAFKSGGWLVVEDVDPNGAEESVPFSSEFSAVIGASRMNWRVAVSISVWVIGYRVSCARGIERWRGQQAWQTARRRCRRGARVGPAGSGVGASAGHWPHDGPTVRRVRPRHA